MLLDDQELIPAITPLDQAVGEYLARIDSGEVLDREEFLAAHSALRDELVAFFFDFDLTMQFAGSRDGFRPDTSIVSLAATAQLPSTRPGRERRAAACQEVSPTFAGPFPATFGQYRMQKLLGHGAMGEVYLADDETLGRQVALKVPRKSVFERPDSLARFHREARAYAKLRHQNICPVYEVNSLEGIH